MVEVGDDDGDTSLLLNVNLLVHPASPQGKWEGRLGMGRKVNSFNVSTIG